MGSLQVASAHVSVADLVLTSVFDVVVQSVTNSLLQTEAPLRLAASYARPH